MLRKLLNPKNDWAFKHIFGHESNKDILIHFLNDMELKPTPIKDVTYLKPTFDPESREENLSIVDVLCEDETGDKFIIEMQLAKQIFFRKRVVYYTAKTYCNQRSRRTLYKDLKSVFCLSIVDFLEFKNKKHWFCHMGIQDMETHEQDIPELQLFFIQLPLFQKSKRDLKTMSRKEKWIYFLKNAEDIEDEELEEMIGKDQIIRKACNALNEYGLNKQELLNYQEAEIAMADLEGKLESSKIEGINKGRIEGRNQGIIEGINKEKIEIAKNMIKKKSDINFIVEVTGLDEKAVKKLKEELDIVSK